MSLCFQFAQSGTCTFGARCKFDHILNNGTSHVQGRLTQDRQRHQQRNSESHLDEFFARYPAFSYNASAAVMTEFYRMCNFFSWGRDDEEKESAREHLKDAMTQQFNSRYGTDVDDLSAWRNLCRVLEIDPIPDELKACRDMVKRAHVNIVDLVDTPNTGQRVKVFDSVQQLSAYTKDSGKYFPKENAYAGGVLKFLLREILNPPAARTGRTRGGRKRGRRNM